MTEPSSPAGPASPAGSDGADPSMEDILASIRRILNEDEPAAGSVAEPEDEDDVLVLDRSMLVNTPDSAAEAEEPAREVPPDLAPAVRALPEPPPFQAPFAEPPSFRAPPAEPLTFDPQPGASSQTLVAPETAAAAASSVDGLLRTLAASRSSQVYRGGPTIEDLVREEIRPLLKDWLDNHLPPMVERLVRAEIERVVGRAVP